MTERERWVFEQIPIRGKVTAGVPNTITLTFEEAAKFARDAMAVADASAGRITTQPTTSE